MSTEMSIFTMNPENLTSIAEFEALSMQGSSSRLVRAARANGTLDTALHNGHQIKTEDIVGHVLTLSATGYAFAPATNVDGTPIYEVDENGETRIGPDGEPIQAMSKFPVMKFAEAPGWWYNGGKRYMDILAEFVREVGDDETDVMLPKVNAEIAACGGIKCYFEWKDSTKNRGQRYVDIKMC